MIRKIFILMLMSTLICCFFPVDNVTAQYFSENVLYVGGSGLNNFTTIQDAIYSASEGDTIFVYNGIYYENLIVNKTVNLVGEDKYNTIIDGSGIGNVVTTYANDISMTGFTIRNSGITGEDAGIKVFSSNNSIFDVKTEYNQYGIWVPTEGNYITHISNSNNIKGSYFVENNIILNFFNTSDFNSRVVSFRNYTISLSSVNSNTTISYIIDVSTINYTINWNGNMITVIEQPSNAIVVRLPNNRFGIKYMDKEPVTLPINSSLLDKNEVNTTSSIIILVPEWNSLIGLNAIENFSIDELTSISYSQKVNALNSYKLATDLIGLRNYSDYIHSYWIDWGDGHNESVTIPFLRYITMTNKTVFYKPTNTVIGTWSSNNFNLLNDKYNFLPIHKYSKSGDYKISIGTEDIFGNNYILSRNTTILYEGGLKHTYFIVVEHKETVTAGAGGIGLLSLLIIFTESGKYKFLSFLLFIPLYTRFNKEDILDNFVRGQIYGFIKTQPGVHYNNIMRELDLKNGTLSYHLQMLEKTGLVKSRMEGLQYRAFYPTGMKFPEKERYRLSDLQIEILKIIKEKDGIIQNEIRDKLGEKRQIINYNVKVLHQAGLIKAIRKGRETHCYLTDEGRGITEFADESANENTISANESP